MRTVNRLACFVALLSLPSLSLGSDGELGRINLLMTATLVANSCEVSAGSINSVVNMGSWPTRQFSSAAPTTAPVRFVINLENCSDLTKGVSITFNGVANSTDRNLLALSGNGSAQNIAIALLDQNRMPLPLGQALSVAAPINQSRSAALVFYSQYRATGARVTPGTANADATFTLSYE